MPPFGPIKRKDLVSCLRQLGFSGPHSGKKHSFVMKGELKIRLPNPHQSDIGKSLLAQILREAEISREEWEQL